MSAADILAQFNGVVSNTFTSAHDVEGRLVAGTMTGGATFYNNPRSTTAASAFAAINAITVTSGVTNANVNNGGNVDVQGTNAGHFNLNGGHFVTTPSFAMADFTKPLDALSATIASLGANSTINASDPNNFTFVETPDSSGQAVFRVSAATLQTARNIVFSGSATTIIVDVTGTTFTESGNFNANDFLNQHVLWNFNTATSLSFQGWHGTVLAGAASVSNSSAMEGVLYAKNFNGGGELHDFSFAGQLPNTPTSVPEPASLLIIGLGLAGLAATKRRGKGRARKGGDSAS